MNKSIKYLPLAVSLILYLLLWLVMHPLLGFNLDSDCVAYLSIAERVASGDYLKSINGLWSPMNSWMLALCIRNGMDAWMSAKILNAVFGGILLLQAFFLFLRFNVTRPLTFYLMTALSIAMVYFVYFQMFGDILQMIFVLAYLLVLWRSSGRPPTVAKAMLCGIIMGLAFYAKAYSFFFFVVHFSATVFWYVRQKKMNLRTALPVIVSAVCFSLIIMLPWTLALHQKYHEWSLNGHAGKLNMSWYINSGKSFRTDIDLLIPPSYDDSPSFWEDPYLSQQNLSSPFTSAAHFIRWIFRIAHTCIVTVFCFQEISFLALGILLMAFYFFFFRKQKPLTEGTTFDIQLLLLAICILPLGYLMMHIETRYIWLNVILLMVLGAVCYEHFGKDLQPRFVQPVFGLVFAISFIVYPLFQFENLKNKNRDLFELSTALTDKNIQGRFTSNVSDAGRMWVIAWLTKSNYYTIEKTNYTYDQLIAEMKRYDVKYYFFESEHNVSQVEMKGMQKIVEVGNLNIFERL
jgi:hypothetical protein